MGFYLAQALTGLAQASSLFLIASGLSIIFGVTRVVNFAHGAFTMLGAYVAYTLVTHLDGPFGFWGGLVVASLVVAALGALLEMTLLRRLYRAPELFQLLATFGVTLVVEDLAVLIWGPDDLLGPRAPGFKGAVTLLGQAVPSYDLFLVGLAPVVFGLLTLVFHRTRFGVLVRAATQDREMVAALGVDQRWLFTAVFALGTFLAALGGALQIPRDAVNHTMDLRIIVDVFVVVVIGGLGSIGGALVAAIVVAELNAFGILAFPAVSIVLVFLVMALVLTVRPHGLFGRAQPPVRSLPAPTSRPWAPFGWPARTVAAVLAIVAALLPFWAGPYGLAVGAEIAVAVIFAASLQLLMSPAGLVSFGHAAYFGLGVYGAALAVKLGGLSMGPAIGCGVALGLGGAALFGWLCVRLSGVYFAMLTLAFAQIVWSVAFQWTDVTGGDNGLLGIWPAPWAATPRAFYWLCVAVAVTVAGLIRVVTFSPFGFGLRAVRDATGRAEALGFSRARLQWGAFTLAGGLAALAGGLFAFLKGSVFPDSFGVGTSVDGLVTVLLGGVGTISGSVAGAILYKGLSIWLVSQTDYSKLVLGIVIVALCVALPRGLGGLATLLSPRGTRHDRVPATPGTPRLEGAE
ncbi:ABC transporter permease [Lichenihabitans sp. Uapishka_5]|uniref:ABC transporter permease n=1 Tax=Lichenihabitans sp. Uapishka_5 TaxID=3037302 RepID=UPI0029E825FA|nr:ABC transporter permease [Lichenihabitans sp. Uapishka_5]MDX7949949.1 ABC transporter permease [Lichenihabitans sp. Uapishka_5]